MGWKTNTINWIKYSIMKLPKELQETLRDLIWSKEPFKVEVRGRQLTFHTLLDVKEEDRARNANLLADWLKRQCGTLDLRQIPYKKFMRIRFFLDDIEAYSLSKELDPEQKRIIEAKIMAFRLGMKVPYEYLLKEENQELVHFLKGANLPQRVFAVRLQLPFCGETGLSIPFEAEGEGTRFIPWRNLRIIKKRSDYGEVNSIEIRNGKEILCKCKPDFNFDDEYYLLHAGIVKYGMKLSKSWRPLERRNPNEWGKVCKLEIWSYWERPYGKLPSLYHGTHTYLTLFDEKGHVRVAGQDMLADMEASKFYEKLSTKKGYLKIDTPDDSHWLSTSIRSFRHVKIPISRREHDRLVLLVEKDKSDKSRTCHVMKGNCVSWVISLLKRGLGIQVDGSYHLMHLFLKENIRSKTFQNLTMRYYGWYKKLPLKARRLMIFFPPYYFMFVLTGSIIRIGALKNYKKSRHCLKDVVFRPHMVTVDHPHRLHEVLSELSDEDGVLSRDI